MPRAVALAVAVLVVTLVWSAYRLGYRTAAAASSTSGETGKVAKGDIGRSGAGGPQRMDQDAGKRGKSEEDTMGRGGGTSHPEMETSLVESEKDKKRQAPLRKRVPREPTRFFQITTYNNRGKSRQYAEALARHLVKHGFDAHVFSLDEGKKMLGVFVAVPEDANSDDFFQKLKKVPKPDQKEVRFDFGTELEKMLVKGIAKD